MVPFRLLLMLSGVLALYEDQIGKFDWRRELIGYPIQTAFEEVKGPSEYITVHTNLGILASVSARDGQIVWRRTMPPTETVKYVFGLRGMAISVSTTGIVRYWKSDSGVLIREMYSKVSAPVITCSRLPSKNSVICARKRPEETVISVFTERSKLHEFTIKSEVESIYTDEGNNVAFLVSVADGHLTVQKLHLNDFALDDGSFSIKTPGLESLQDTVLNVDNILSYLTDGQIVSINMQTGESNVIVRDLDPECKIVTSGQTESRHTTDSIFYQCGSKTVLVVNLDAPDFFTITVPDDQDHFDVKFHHNLVNPFASIQTGPRSIKVVNGVDGQVEQVTTKHDIKDVWVNVYPTKTGYDLKVLTLGVDGSVRFTQKDHDLWVREEALSEVARVEIIDLPPDSNQNINPQEWTFIQRIRIQWTLVKTWIQSVLSEFESGNMFKSRTVDPLISQDAMVRDQFNLHKLIFIVTKNGNVYGLDSLSSAIKWKHRIGSINSCSIQTLIISDTNIHDGNVMVIGKCSDDHTEIVEMNPMTGEVVGQNTLNGQKVLRVEVLRSHLNHVHPALVLTDGDKAELIGRKSDIVEIRDQIRDELKSMSIWLADQENGQIRGGRVHLDKSGLTGTFENEWTFQTPSDHKISSISAPLSTDMIHSQGRPLANRSVLYKFLSPNFLAVVTESTEQSNIEAMSITLYLIDAVTGQMLHSANHKRSTGPVNIALAENWVVYSYWAAKMHRTEITAVELYQGETNPNATHWDSRNQDLPIAIQKSFVVSEAISALGVTQSQRGITNKAVLIATKSGNIVSLPRIFLDPRRRLIPESSDREEGIMPYDPELKLTPNFNINYNKTIDAVSAFHVAISGLESTCIVFSVGRSDLFWTRVHPSSMFDVLKDDFDHLMITIIMIGFFVGTAACKRLAQLKITNRLWQ